MEIIGNINTLESPITQTSSAIQNTGNTPSISANTLANLPTAGTTGRIYITTDTNNIYRDTGSAWVTLGSSLTGTANQVTVTSGVISLSNDPIIPGTSGMILPTGTTAQRPATPTVGTIRYNTTTQAPEIAARPYNLLTRFNGITRQIIDDTRGKWKDDFLGGVPATTSFTSSISTIGEMRWSGANSTTASWLIGGGSTTHNGIINVTTSATLSSTATMFLGATTSAAVLFPTDVEYYQWIVLIPNITTLTTRLGIGANIATAAMGTAGVFFQFDPAVSANWQFITRNASVSTTITTTTAVAANTWYALEAFYDGTTWTPVINGVVQSGSTTNIPSAVSLNIGVNVTTNVAAARNLNVDYFCMYTKELTRF